MIPKNEKNGNRKNEKQRSNLTKKEKPLLAIGEKDVNIS